MLSIHADPIAPQAWRNGGGRTRELLVRPAGPDWKVRVSLAEIDADGPFSAFPGVERWFVVVQGAGVVLQFAGVERVMRWGDAPLCFDGVQAPACALINGPTRDLNLMLRGGVGAMRAVRPGEPWAEAFEERGLFTLCAGQLQILLSSAEGEGAGDQGVAHQHAPPHATRRVAAHTLLWNIGAPACCFVPDGPAESTEPAGPGLCGWWLGFSGTPS